ncbi:MAG: RsmE family RNA methyltransferase [Acidimicrobiales bacterium]
MDRGTAAELRRRPLVLVDDLAAPRLSPDDAHHFSRVLRLAPGQTVTLGDGRGGWCEARFAVEPEPVGPVVVEPAPAPVLCVGFVPVKGEGPDWYVQKLTELGIDEIVPLVSERSVVRWDGNRAARAHERMVRAAREACLQCRRLHLPAVAPVTGLARFLAERVGAGAGRGSGVALADPDGAPPASGLVTVVVGPEGGFSPAELALAPAVALPGHILRAETAAVVAAGVLAGLRSGLLASP